MQGGGIIISFQVFKPERPGLLHNVPAFTSSLNSNDVFLLRTQAEHYLWFGKVGRLAQQSHPSLGSQPCTHPLVSKGKGA